MSFLSDLDTVPFISKVWLLLCREPCCPLPPIPTSCAALLAPVETACPALLAPSETAFPVLWAPFLTEDTSCEASTCASAAPPAISINAARSVFMVISPHVISVFDARWAWGGHGGRH